LTKKAPVDDMKIIDASSFLHCCNSSILMFSLTQWINHSAVKTKKEKKKLIINDMEKKLKGELATSISSSLWER
jgi:hypothetical protein